nr:circadian clock KaiB family protein [Aphanothece sacrum]
MTETSVVPSDLFKGIALFTPGGDVVYCRDKTKQIHWHSHLCVVLQECLKLPAPPHFLVPGYTATVDRWFCSGKREVRMAAEVYPAVKRYQLLLNVLFDTPDLVWETAQWQDEICNPIILETYRSEFPQLWESHDLIYRLENPFLSDKERQPLVTPSDEIETSDSHQGYILRLFVSGNSSSTKNTLKTIHHLLETELQHPYTLKVIDIIKHPEEAETHQISATPTLLRVSPKPMRRIVGEFQDLSRVLQIINYKL